MGAGHRHAEKPLWLVATTLGLVALLATCLSLGVGAVPIGAADLARIATGQDATSTAYAIVAHVRLPRTVAALAAGAALATSGAIIQSVLANPLAAPNVIGVNAGAGLAVALCCAIAPQVYAALPLAAFVGAFAAVMVVIAIAERAGASRMTLVLAGVALSAVLSAAIDAVVTLVPDALPGYSDFRIGGLSSVTMARVAPAAVAIAACLAIAVALADDLDVLALGTDIAQALGLRVRRCRLAMLALAAALAGAAVSFAGLLGFVGLIVPHLMRQLVGEDSRRLVVSSALGGASLLTLCDVASRVVFSPYELPVGIVMSLAGGPFFIWLLLRQRGGRIHD